MLIPQPVSSIPPPEQGSHRVGIAELRRQLASPSTIEDGHRQRLLELATRLSRVQRLGDEYTRVAMSQYAEAAGGLAAVA